MKRCGILAGGNWIVDRVKQIDVYPEQDALANIAMERETNGGAPFNLLKALHRLGAGFPLEAVGLVGDDPAGRWVLEACARSGIRTAQLRCLPGERTAYTDVMTVAETGRRTFFHYRGANARLEPRHFDFEATRARWFHLGYLLLLDALDRPGPHGTGATEVLRAARRAGLKTSVDLVSEDSDRFAPVVLAALPEVDLLFLNEFEAGRTMGLALRRGGCLDLAAVEAAAGGLLAAGVRESVVIHFPEGVMAATAKGILWQAAVALPPEAIRGAVGAGDALAAGVLLALHEGEPLEAALALGVCVAAASLEGVTASDAIRPRRECEALARTYGWREIARKN